ncbi:hypothetical protein [Streptomyces sp. NPDC047079]|uniref:hypothetical protein n=1 Tax=Streptomyces sp. NPDC047079 TaxID=3154607 RepID=UPI0033CE4F40
MTVDQKFISTARRPGSSGHADQYGYGLVNPLAALRSPVTISGSAANPLLSARPLGNHTDTGIGWLIGISVGGAVALTATSAWIVIRRRKAPPAKRTSPASTPSRGASRPAGKSSKKKQKART